MKHRAFSPRAGAVRALAKSFLLGWLLAGGLAGFAPALDAAERCWNGLGLGAPQEWSYPFNWIPVGVPQDGEDLVFGDVFNTDTLDTMVNDLSGLTVRSMTFHAAVEFFNATWILNGNEWTVTGDLTCEQDSDFNCGLTRGRSNSTPTLSSIRPANAFWAIRSTGRVGSSSWAPGITWLAAGRAPTRDWFGCSVSC